MGKFGQNDPIESCLVYDADNGCLVYTTNLGNDKPVKLPSDKVTFGWTGECELVVMVNGVECDRQDITSVLEKYYFDYSPETHTITAGPDGDEVPFVLNCATLELDTSNGCELVYTNEKGGENRIAIPVLSMSRDEAACTITADDGKGGEFVFYEGANPETDIALELDDNKDLCMRYKSKEAHVVLGNFVTDVTLDQTNCILKVFKWCDDEPTNIDILAAVGLTKNDDGGFDLQLKDQVCTFSPATLTQNPDNPLQFTFDNQYGQTVTITLPTSTVSDNGNGTATITLADGTQKTDVVCGQQGTVVDNGDGTGTVTMNDGTMCTFLKTVEFPADIRITGLSFEESEDGSMHSLVATLSDGTTLNAGPIVDSFSSVAPNAEGEGGGVGTATITTPQGVKNDVVCGVQSSVVANEDAPGTATITQNDGSVKTDVLCGSPSTVVQNAEGEGGGVGTATMTQTDGTVKADVVCGVQSTVVPSEDGRTATFTQNDGSTKEVVCAGNDSIVLNEEGVGGGVGTATVTLSGGDVKADVVCGVQSSVAANTGEGGEPDGTATILQNDGSTKTDVVCGVQSTVVDQENGTAVITQNDGSTCPVSTEQSRLLCDDPEDGILSFSTLDLKTGVETKQQFSSVNRCAIATGQRVTTIAATDSATTLVYPSVTFFLACPQIVTINGYYDVIVDNPDGVVWPGLVTDLYSGVEIDGATGAGNNSAWLTLSDSPITTITQTGGLVGDPVDRRHGEYNLSGTTCIELDAGLHTLALEVYKWRANTGTWSYRFSQARMTVTYTEMVCK